MKTFGALIQGYPILARGGELTRLCDDVAYDSRRVRPGSLFVCVKGRSQDAHGFIEEALRQGASALVVENKTFSPELLPASFPWARVQCARDFLAYASQMLWDEPGRKLFLFGFLGGSGKETRARLWMRFLNHFGEKAACFSGMQLDCPKTCYFWGRSIPQAREYATALRTAALLGMKYLSLPLSDESLKWRRAAYMKYKILVWTGDFHQLLMRKNPEDPLLVFLKEAEHWIGVHEASIASEEATPNWKSELESWSVQTGVPVPYATVGKLPGADYELLSALPLNPEIIQKTKKESVCNLSNRVSWCFRGEKQEDFCLITPGEQAALNALLIRALEQFLIETSELICRDHSPWSQRAQVLEQNGSSSYFTLPQSSLRVVLDSAWRAEHLAALIENLRPWVQEGGRLRLLHGAGGARPIRERRAQGQACAHADFVCFTSSYSRSETGLQIAADLAEGLKRVRPDLKPDLYADRKQAIGAFLKQAKPEDLNIITGRGEEDYLIDSKSLDLVTDARLVEEFDQSCRSRKEKNYGSTLF